MAVQDIVTLKAQFDTGDTITEAAMINLIDTLFDQGGNNSLLFSDSGSDLIITGKRRGGDPTFSKVSTGEYRLDIPSGAELLDATLAIGTGNVDGSNQLTLIVDDTDGNLYRPVVIGIESNGVGLDPTLYVPSYTLSAVGQITAVFPNLNFGASGCKLMLYFTNALT